MAMRCKPASSAALAAALALLSSHAWAQATPPPVITDEGSRGIRIVPGEAEPPPAPPTPAPPAAAPPAPPPPAAPPPVAKPPIATTTTPAPVIQLCARPEAKPDLTLTTTRSFDRDLAKRLRQGQRVVIDLPEPYPQDGTPPGSLPTWLAEVQSSGGQVRVKQYCEAARGALGDWLASLFQAKPGGLYRPARYFDVVLHADALDKLITQVEFTRRVQAGS